MQLGQVQNRETNEGRLGPADVVIHHLNQGEILVDFLPPLTSVLAEVAFCGLDFADDMYSRPFSQRLHRFPVHRVIEKFEKILFKLRLGSPSEVCVQLYIRC